MKSFDPFLGLGRGMIFFSLEITLDNVENVHSRRSSCRVPFELDHLFARFQLVQIISQ